MSIKISHNFDAGAIDVVQAERPEQIELNIRKDSHADFTQWFYFRLQGARDQACTMRFLNAGKATYPGGWENYRVAASYDNQNWFRVDTSYDGQVMTVNHTPNSNSVYYAYFEPYGWERHLALLGKACAHPQVAIEDLGSTIDGRDMNLLVVGDTTNAKAKKVWIIARQHPGESMAEWFVEGLLDALLSRANPFARKLLQHAVFYIVPNMNPDGSVRGNLRTNAAGANLNREWMAPTMERSPEVFVVRQKLHEIGCDMFFDIHGDEALPYNFVAGSEMLAGFTPQQMQEQDAFIAAFMRASPDFQNVYGYAPGKYNQDMLTLASKYIGHTFKCLSLTLEMPFKDNADLPDPDVGWNGARSMQLGAAMLQPVLDAVLS